MTRTRLRQEERRWRRGDLLAVLFAIALGGAFAWIVLMVQGLNEDLRDSNDARDALARQVERLGAKPVAGPPGSRGDPGDGKPGPPGPRGPAGQTGDRGSPGPTGKDGARGQDGKSGATGKDGTAGEPGPKGDTGTHGKDGTQGEAGPPGPKGEPGESGPRGEQGPQGERGPAGPAPSSWSFTYNGATYTCTPTSDGSTSYSCAPSGGSEPEPNDTRPQAALDPSRRTYP